MPQFGNSIKNWRAVVDLLPVAVVFAAESEDSGIPSRSYFANQTAHQLLNLNSEQPLKSQLEALQFFPDVHLTGAATEPEAISSPIIAALSGEVIDRRDLIVANSPVSIESNQFYGDDERIYSVTLQPRDHRLFFNSNTPMDMSSAEVSLRDFISFEKIVAELSTLLRNSKLAQMDAHIHHALKRLGEFCQTDRAYVFLFDFEHTTMTNTHEWVNDGISSHVDDLQEIPNTQLPWFFTQIKNQGVFAITDTSKIPQEGALEKFEFEREDIRSTLCVGLYELDELIGFIGLDMVARNRRWSEADIRRTRLIGELIATTINNERIYYTLQTSQQQLMANNDALRELVLRDGLTGLANRRQFTNRLQEELARAVRQKHELSVAMFDIDDFRAYNEKLGLPSGDALVQKIASLLKQHFRRNGELVCRFAGEKFAVMLPHLSFPEACQRSDDFLELLKQQGITHPQTSEAEIVENNSVTVSGGVACLSHSENADDLIHQAENMLTFAKANGRNRVEYKQQK
ncbi:diguanylate cyclase (GGDEF) domain-containing protein [Idiomarina sp. A28L]|nr:diguanylate cyclase (GGDEF) domain-containing protein [Idiomarina sp. A28L]